jgi:hypothetical protein
MRADDPHAGQRDVPAVLGRAERAGGEPARAPGALPLNFGNRIFGPLRLPVRESAQLPNAIARFASPDEYASFEFSDHHGAVSFLVSFHALRRL